MIRALFSSLSIKLLKYLFIFLFPLLAFSAKEDNSNNINFEYNNISLKSALLDLIQNNDISIIFPDSIPNRLITKSCSNCTNDEAISRLLSSTELKWEKAKSQYIITLPISEFEYSISGRILDLQSDEPIAYANVFIPKLLIGDISRDDGVFSIPNITSKSCTLVISYIGYNTKKIPLLLPKDQSKFQSIYLLPKILISKEISITSSSREFMDRSNNPGQVSFSPRHIATLPNLGEVDIFRSLQFLPGIQLGLGGTSDLYIRGGSPDQNLIILDGMPIYTTGHMFGFISGISANAIKDIQIYKGSIPAKYGGRISSVIELKSRAGNNSKIHGSFYGNLISQGLSLELPLFNRANWIINYRKSMPSINLSNLYKSIQEYVTGDDKFNILTKTAEDQNTQNADYDINSSYQDIISRITFLLNPHHRFTLTHMNSIDSIMETRTYFGFNSIFSEDITNINEKTDLENRGTVLNWSSHWNHLFSTHITLSIYDIASNYFSIQENLHSLFEEKNIFSDHQATFTNQYKGIKNHNISSGIVQSNLNIGFNNHIEDRSIVYQSNSNQKGLLYSFFLLDQWKFENSFELQSGIRVAYFEKKNKYYNEPRFALKYKIYPSLSLEASIDRHHQFIHRLSNQNNTRGSQNMWVISSAKIPVISSNNLHIGLNWEMNDYSISLSGYNYRMQNLFQFENQFIPAEDLSKSNLKVYLGSGEKLGSELIIRKKVGVISGWISYQFNQAKYNFQDLNNGEKYLADHNREHEIKTVLTMRLWNTDFSANWVLSSGGLYTDTEHMDVQPGYNIITNSNRNEKRLPSIHHLDINISKSIIISKTLIDIGCSIYNIYNKNNISHKRYNPWTPKLSMSDVSMFGITPNAYIKISF